VEAWCLSLGCPAGGLTQVASQTWHASIELIWNNAFGHVNVQIIISCRVKHLTMDLQWHRCLWWQKLGVNHSRELVKGIGSAGGTLLMPLSGVNQAHLLEVCVICWLLILATNGYNEYTMSFICRSSRRNANIRMMRVSQLWRIN